jgi:hypothetical protein
MRLAVAIGLSVERGRLGRLIAFRRIVSSEPEHHYDGSFLILGEAGRELYAAYWPL